MDETSALEATPETIRHAMDGASVGIVITNPQIDDNPIVFVNNGFVEMTQYSRDFAIGRNCRFLQGEQTHKDDVTRIRKALDAGEDVAVKMINHRADGSKFCNQLLISPVKDDDGRITAWFAIQREVQPETGDTGGNKARPDHPTPSMVMLRELQHRVKNHLSMIVSLIRLQANRELTKDSFDALAHRVEALALLYDAMLTPHGDGTAKTVDAGEYLNRVANVIGDISGRPDIKMTHDFEEVHLPVDTSGRLGLLLTELLANTFEHAFDGQDKGCVDLRFRRVDDDTVRLTVEDDGIGLPEGSNWPNESASIDEQRDHAEDDTGALDTTSGESNSGLGGSIVLGLTKMLAADLDVRSGDAGTKITVELNERELEKV